MSEANDWIHKLHQLSAEQLNELIAEFGPIAVLTRERDAKLLMSALDGLGRDLALAMVKPHPEWMVFHVKDQAKKLVVPADAAFELAEIFRRNSLTSKEIAELENHCSEDGLELLFVAKNSYMDDPTTQAHRLVAEEALRASFVEMEAADEVGDDAAKDEVAKNFQRRIQDADERLRLKKWLEDEYGITDLRSVRLYLQAIKVVSRQQPELYRRADIKGHNMLMNSVNALYQQAVANQSTPQALVEWRALIKSGAMKKQPDTIFRRPNGTEVWGDGLPVIYDKEGRARKPMQGIFGKTVAEGSVPFNLAQMAELAFGKDERENG